MLEGITKKHSQILYGIAILFMLYHHLFCLPERLNCEYFSVLGPMEQKAAWFGKLCVAIFAFISGYAMSISIQKVQRKGETIVQTYIHDFKYAMKRICFLLKRVLLVFAIFIPMGIVMKRITFDGSEFIKGLFRGRFIYNGEWWYIFQYVLLMLSFPFVDVIVSRLVIYFQKHKKVLLIASIVLPFGIITGYICFDTAKVLLWQSVYALTYRMHLVYFVVFLIGYLCAKFNLLQFRSKANTSKWMWLIAILVIIGCFMVRTVLAKDVFYLFADILIIVPFVWSVCVLSEYIPKTTRMLQKIGKHSTYMWLTHSFYCYYYFREFITFSRISTVMFVQLFAVSIFFLFCCAK